MPHTTRTIRLSDSWDITTEGSGKIALYHDSIATAQSVANECRRFINDSYFDYDIGIPHFNIELGHVLPDSVLRSSLREAALRVSDVFEILDIDIDNIDREARLLTGSVTFKTISGEVIQLQL